MSSVSLSQVSLAGAILIASVGIYLAITPPNPSGSTAPITGDTLRWLTVTDSRLPLAASGPLAFLALHTALLASLHPNIPLSLLRHGTQNGLNRNLITWSTATVIPLTLLLIGVPLRLLSYLSLGKNFTYTLAEPDRLMTTGIYHYVQHPSYTGLTAVIIGTIALLVRVDGVLSCWITPRMYRSAKAWEMPVVVGGLTMVAFLVWTRIKDEERMLKAEFGVEWERWHATTARLVPCVF